MKSLPKQFISCDWGTSNFRLRLVDTESLEVLQEHSTDKGVKKVYQDFVESETNLSQKAYFGKYLAEQLKFVEHAEVNTVIASGMLSSSIGMQELEYAKMPMSAEGRSLNSSFEQLDEKYELLLISGTKTEESVMRGEEIQALGLAERLKSSEGVLLLPGTHSKHIHYAGGVFKDFKTFMTGELFEIISNQSILNGSIQKSAFSETYAQCFLDGVQRGAEGELTEALFSIRASSLFGNRSKESNFYFLSGLLIGSELGYLKRSELDVHIAASGVLSQLYQKALASLKPTQKLYFYDEEVLEKALLAGQKKILSTYV
ncbi:2-dehydro-3-deoxygalactonokinase [Sediminitomix flava]|uniref:2-dehydro-3-deoxygalactonokinase n=1 Tax=Sediminitomix flava TaxID=379075 RepID=A0A315Z9Q8_SEDFL|nr:2-dehydro-3-deoxygalactonokinase [Sediminitomix flava]PWJ41793.1 2-dehydro-3-deoxygalactonokinase [Sediminitomix flava]